MPDKPLSISKLTHQIKQQLESAPGLQRVQVEGELAQLTRARSGHWYFTLKDADAQLSCVMFRGANQQAPQHLDTGDTLLAEGAIMVYTSRGVYQLRVERLRHRGLGELYQRFLELKARLEAEGYFASERKRPLPAYPRRAAVLTSASGAVFHDIINTLRRRYPVLELVLIPVTVQGKEAVPSLRRGFELLREADVEVAILARGGGSLEDLWCFNEEAVATLILEAPVPVVSAIGHETDFTIADFVADVRAATPTAAAERIAPNRSELLGNLAYYREGLSTVLARRLERDMQHLDDAAFRMASSARQAQQQAGAGLQAQQTRLLRNIRARETAETRSLDRQRNALSAAARGFAGHERERLAILAERLANRNLRATLARGFSRTFHEGRLVRSTADVQPGNRVQTEVADGRFAARVEDERAE